MPTLTAVRTHPWLRNHYQRLLARGKLPKVALGCLHAQAAARDLQRRQAPARLHRARRDHMKKPLAQGHGISCRHLIL
jgi:hypothetical protein